MRKMLTVLLTLALHAAALAQVIIPTSVAGLTYSFSANVIPGTPTDATLLSSYPCSATYNGYTATTSDLGSESCGITAGAYRWSILSPPVPTGASSNGLHTLLFAIHPVVSDINLTASNGTPISQYFTVGAPGSNSGGKIATFNGYISGTNLYVSNSQTGTISAGLGVQCTGCAVGTNVVSGSSSPYTINISQTVASSGSPIAITLTYFTTTNGQLTLINPGSNSSKGAFANFATFNGGYSVANMATGLAFLNGSSAFYIEAASTDSVQSTTTWDGLALYTTENQASNFNGNTVPYVEYDVNENGFSSGGLYGFTQTLHNHTTQGGGVQQAYYSGNNVTYTTEQIWGGVWSPSSGFVEPCFNGTCYSNINFSSLSTPITSTEWSGKHFTISVSTGLHSGSTAYNMQLRYISVWVAP